MFATISAMQLRTSIGDVLNRIEYKGDRVVIERKGTPVAAMIRVEDLRRLEALDLDFTRIDFVHHEASTDLLSTN